MQHLKDKKGPIAKIIFLLMDRRVQKELDIVRPQLKSIKEAADRLREKSKLKIKEMQKLPDPQKPKARSALMRKLAEGANAFLAEVLRPDQLKRYQQIRLQHEGIGAFLNESVRSELSLTKEQIASIKSINVKTILHKGTKSPVAGVREQAIQEVISMLTEQQATKCQEILGEPFDLGVTESQSSDALPGAIQRPLSHVPKSQESSSHAPGTSLQAPNAPAGDPFADDGAF
ncbi:MAG: hypothetical protein GY774_38405 [Planctomycetes bacterium]|nr:hypothetical protein [Planctomycetota bacterium]